MARVGGWAAGHRRLVLLGWLVALISALEPFFNWRSRWILMEEAQYRLQRIRDELEYLRVWVSRLRRKLEADPSQPVVIRTFQGIGYLLDVDSPAPVAAGEPADS